MANPNIYALSDPRWVSGAASYNAIWMDVTNGAGGSAVGLSTSRLIKLTNNTTEVFGIGLAGNVIINTAAFNGSIISLTQTWTGGGTYTGILYNLTDTSSSSASRLVDIQIAGQSWFSITKPGNSGIIIGQTGNPGAFTIIGSSGGTVTQYNSGNQLNASGTVISWDANTTLSGQSDLFIRRAATATLQYGAADTNVTTTTLTSISNASPAVFTTPSNHNLSPSTPLTLTTTGALPTGLATGTQYYVLTTPTASTYTVSLTVGGAAINTSSAGSGTHSQVVGPIAQYIRAQSAVTGTDVAAAPLYIQGSRSTGAGKPGQIILQVAASAGSGATQNAYITAVIVDPNIFQVNAAGLNRLDYNVTNSNAWTMVGNASANYSLYVNNSGASNFTGGILMLSPNISAGFRSVGLNWGVAGSNNNAGALNFFYSSAGSSLNAVEIALYGKTTSLNWTASDILTFGGYTTSFPALKRSTTGLEYRLADDSAPTWFKVAGMTLASLPTAASAGSGARMYITDALAPVFNTTAVGGGAVSVCVFSDNTQWKVG